MKDPGSKRPARFFGAGKVLLALLFLATPALSGQTGTSAGTLPLSEPLSLAELAREQGLAPLVSTGLESRPSKDCSGWCDGQLLKVPIPSLARTGNSAPHARGVTSPDTPSRLFATGPAEITLLPDAVYHEILLHHLREAGERIDLSMFLFKITGSPQNRPAQILKELIAARDRGVKVGVLLERSDRQEELSRENQKVAELLRQKGVEVSFSHPRRTNHTKLVVIDSRYCFVGSHNLTHAALAHNHELSLLIDSRQVAAQMLDYMAGVRYR